MPQANNNITGQQWTFCGRCGFFFPMGELTKQEGLLVCTRKSCFDDLTPKRRAMVIGELLGSGENTELQDLRQFDKGFFEGYDEVNL